MTDTLDADWTDTTGPPPDDDGRLRCEEPGCEFETASPAGFKRHMTVTHGAQPAGHTPREPRPPREPPPETPAQPAGGPEVAERAPRPSGGPKGRQGLLGRVRDRWKKGSSETGSAPKSRQPKVVSRGRRISIAPDLEDGFFDLGRMLEQSPQYPTGRMIQYQAPAAGVIIDRAVAGTMLDRILVQPIARRKDEYEDVFYLAAPPIMIYMVQATRLRQQAALQAGDQQAARELGIKGHGQITTLKWILRRSVLKMAPAVAEARKRIAEEDALIREAFPELGPGEDPVEVLLSNLFAPPGTGSAPEPTQPEEAATNGSYGHGHAAAESPA